MAITPASFKLRFPEFSSEDDSRIQLFIDDSVIILNETFWSVKYDLGLYYLTAHYLTLANLSEAGNKTAPGQVSSRSVDGTSVSYNRVTLSNENDAYYASTIYGQRYLALRKSLGLIACVV